MNVRWCLFELVVGWTFLLLPSAAFGVPSNQGSDDGLGWRIAQLDLDVDLVPDQAKIVVEGTIQLELEQSESLGPTLFINSTKDNMTFLSVEAEGAESIEINQAMMERPFVRLAHIRYTQPFSAGDRVVVSFAYESDGGSNQFGVSEQAAIASWVDAWHPVPLLDPEQTSLSGQSKSTGTLTLSMPEDWHGAGEGRLASREVSEGVAVERWQCDTPVARSFAAGRFSVVEQEIGDRTLRVYRIGETGVSPSRLAQTIGDILSNLERRFGPYPYESYAIIETPNELGVFGAASLQGMILARPFWFQFADGSLPLFSHEMAHGWWGNLVGTTGAGSLLCSESLAQYSAAIAIESVFGDEAATDFMRFSREDYIAAQCGRGYFQMWRDGTDIALSEMGSGGWYHTLSDAKGHWIYHMLRRRVGDEVFFATLRGLLDRFADARMSLDDVREAFVKAAPEAELEQFFEQWLDQPGAPILAWEWVPVGDDRISVTIRQQQPGQPYQLRLPVEITYDKEEAEMELIDLRERVQSFELTVADEPISINIDPKHRLLIWTPEYGTNPLEDEVEIELSMEQLQLYVGDYEVAEAGTVQFRIKDGDLYSQLVGTGAAAIATPIGEHQFRTNGMVVTFQIQEGVSVGFEVSAGSNKRTGVRIVER